jgi:hypothetical protein
MEWVGDVAQMGATERSGKLCSDHLTIEPHGRSKCRWYVSLILKRIFKGVDYTVPRTWSGGAFF